MSDFFHAKYSENEIKKLLEIGSRHVVKTINAPEEETDKSNAKIVNELATNRNTAEEKLREICSKISLFDSLSPNEALAIIKNAQFLLYERGQTLFSQGDTGMEIFFIVSGGADIRLEKNSAAIARVGVGDLLGEMAFIARKPRSATCVSAESGTSAIRFEIDEEALNDATASIFLQLYINISNALVKKLETANALLD